VIQVRAGKFPSARHLSANFRKIRFAAVFLEHDRSGKKGLQFPNVFNRHFCAIESSFYDWRAILAPTFHRMCAAVQKHTEQSQFE